MSPICNLGYRRILLFMSLSIALPLLFACSGGSDNPPQATAPPPGGGTPQATGQPGRFDAPIIAMAPVPNGNGDIYVAGHFTTYNNQAVRPVVRLRPDGTLNDSFKLTDAVTAPSPDLPPSVRIIAIAAADDGSGDLYVGEQHDDLVNSPDTRAQVWKVNSVGAMAPGFTPGTLRFDGTSPFDPRTELFAIVPVGDGSGRVYVGGLFNKHNQTAVNHLVRLNSNGAIDPTFVPDSPTWVWNILPAKDGSGDLYIMTYGQVGPSSFEPLSVERRNADGTVDPAFFFRAIDGPPRTFALVEDGSGDLFVAGGFLRIDANDLRPGFVRLNPDGILDETSPRLNPDGTPDPTSTWPQVISPSVLTKATDGTNDWFVVTDVLTNGRPFSNQLQRHKADGTLDPHFMAGHAGGTTGCCYGVSIVMPAPDDTGDVYAAGLFTTYNSVTVGHIVRVNPNGTLD